MSDTPTPAENNTTTTTSVTKETKSSNTGLKVILIIGLVLLCLCAICGVAGYLIYQSTLNASQGLLNAISNEIQNTVNDDFSNTNDSLQNNDTGSNDTNNETEDSYTFGGDLPSSFPADVPIPSNATVGFSGSSTDGNGVLTHSATLTSPSSVADLLAFYKRELGNEGWTITGEQAFFGTSVTAQKTGREVTVVLFGEEGQETSITIAVN